jgi:tRNA pseudouridine65 synthase
MTDRGTPHLLYLDDTVAVIDKPVGWATHAAKGLPDPDTALSWLRDRLGRWVYPAHRLDRATSGVLAFALDPETAGFLGRQFAQGTVEKRYEAWVRGWAPDAGRIDRPLKSEDGLSTIEAVTYYRTLARVEEAIPVSKFPSARFSRVEVRTETGRFHQIRRHLHSIGHPIIGDTRHGDGAWNRHARAHWGTGRLFLDAGMLELTVPGGLRLRVTHSMPREWGELQRRFGLETAPSSLPEPVSN